MKLIVVVALIHAAACGNVNIRMPYLSPAGVTYVDGSLHAGLAAGPLAYTTATARPYAAAAAPFAYHTPAVAHAPLAYHAPAVAYQAPAVAYQAPAVAYQAPAVAYQAPAVAHAPLAYHAPAVAYQPVTKYAAVPTVHHVPGVANVPVTRYEAQPAVIQKALDVAKPAIKTRKYEIRRPAIQKEFYDIEERIVVRPAGSALVELDEPISKSQKGAAVVSPAAYAIPAVPALRSVVPTYARFAYSPYAHHFQLAHPQLTVAQLGQAPVQTQQQPEQKPEDAQEPQQPQPQQPYPFEQPQQPQQPEQPEQPQQPQQPEQPQSDDNDDDSVSVDNPEFAARSAPETTTTAAEPEPAAAEAEPSIAPEAAAMPETLAASMPEARSIGAVPFGYSSPFDLIPQARSGPSLVPSLRNLPAEVSQSNQQRLIELLTARGGVTEVGLARSGPAVSPVGEAGQIRARVLSATPAPPSAEPTGERVNTRRVVVSRPIETLQEIQVHEPVTKLERIHVQHPTYIKTARQDFVRVPTSVPVYGKAYAPVAHAAVPFAHHQPVVPAYSPYYG